MQTKPRLLEVSDAIIHYDANTLQRLPVKKTSAVEQLKHSGKWAQKIAQAIPDNDGILDENSVDDLLFRSHCEMQRLWEEFLSGTRIAKLLQIFIATLRQKGIKPPYRIVDIGCGIGYNIRWLAANQIFSQDVELIGVDYNQSLINCAQKATQIENLNCKFLVANAFTLSEKTTLFMSTGVIHHFSKSHLPAFFKKQNDCWGFLHFDIQPHMFAPIGAWLFHRARMRIPLAQHDGYLSACRAHDIKTLAQCAKQGAPQYDLIHHGCKIPFFPFIRNMHAIIGIHPNLTDDFLHQLPNPRKIWRKLT